MFQELACSVRAGALAEDIMVYVSGTNRRGEMEGNDSDADSCNKDATMFLPLE